MRIWSSLRWRAPALARACGYRGNPRLSGVEVPHVVVAGALVAAGFDLVARRGQVSVLRRRAA